MGDCRDTRCCAEPGSRCYKKSKHWASCNATCSSHMVWEGPRQRFDNSGYWKATHHHVWECADITRPVQTTSSPTIQPATLAPTSTPAPVTTYKVFDDDTDPEIKVNSYEGALVPPKRDATPTEGRINWIH